MSEVYLGNLEGRRELRDELTAELAGLDERRIYIAEWLAELNYIIDYLEAESANQLPGQ